MRTTFTLLVTLVTVTTAPCLAQKPGGTITPKSNVIILLADDIGVDGIQAYGEGSAPPSTPVIDSLASNGILFRNAWSTPVCSPTRATILTGRHPFRTGVGYTVDAQFPVVLHSSLRLEEITIPELLDLSTGQSYAHAAFGKWHLGVVGVGGLLAPNAAGFSHFSGRLGNIQGASNYFNWMKVVNGVESQSKNYATSDTVDSAVAWINSVEEPWFCYVAFQAAHVPLHKPPPHLHTVDFENVLKNPHKQPLPYWRAMIEAMDTEIGRLLASIPPAVMDRTTILFIGDNGSHPDVTLPPFNEEHSKGTLYEGGVNVPFIVSGPLVSNPGQECEALVNTTDVFSTVAELAGINVAATLPRLEHDSISLVPYLADSTQASIRDYVFAEMFHPSARFHSWPPPCIDGKNTSRCQTDIGFGGPGNVRLSICGEELYSYKLADLTIQNAPPLSVGVLFVSPIYKPTPAFGGTLVPLPPTLISGVHTDLAGEFTGSVLGGLGEAAVFYQAALIDPTLPGSVAISNAVHAQMHGGNIKAIRNGRYKLIFDFRTCEELLFDLVEDPFETENLLDATLSNFAAGSYEELRRHLGELLGP